MPCLTSQTGHREKRQKIKAVQEKDIATLYTITLDYLIFKRSVVIKLNRLYIVFIHLFGINISSKALLSEWTQAT